MRLADHLNKLEYFYIVAESGSLKKASQKIRIGQPQLTKVIQQLEEIVQRPLFVRSAKGMTLTQQGRLLYDYSKKILDSINRAELLIKTGPQEIKGRVRIGTYDSIARYFFPEFLKYLKSSMPDIEVSLQTGRSARISEMLESKELDIAIILSPSTTKKSIVQKVIYTDSFGLYRAPNLPQEFTDHLIYFPFPMNQTKKSIKRFGLVDYIVCDNLETVKSLTEQAIGIGLLPHRVAKQSVLSNKLEPYIHPKISSNNFDVHDIVMCHSKSTINNANRFVVDEIVRFLSLWYNK